MTILAFPEGAVDASYALACTDCTFETTVTGTFSAALNVVDAHRTDHDAGPTGHFVNVRRL